MAENDTEEEVTVQAVDEVEQIKAWRRAELERAGYTDDLAQVVGNCLDIDLHDAISYVQRGCRPSVAALILL
jgi:hypothetical protein